MTWRVVHVNQSEKMHLKLDNIVIKNEDMAASLAILSNQLKELYNKEV